MNGKVEMIDPSELLRPELKFAKKPISAFRDYTIDTNDPLKERVRITYEKMHTYQTVDFVIKQKEKWLKFNHFKATIREALLMLNDMVDESDPDINLPNIMHAFQTAESIRNDFPDMDWFHLTGLIHDLGKVMALFGEPQWAVTGDTYIVGCDWADSIVYRETSFRNNPDGKDQRYNTKYGIYKPNCGLDNVLMSWGHDEYMYQVLKHNGTTLPDEALYMIRYHSFYPWHTSNSYTHLTNDYDNKMKEWVLKLNKYDLYTKCEEVIDVEALWPYYENIIKKYIPKPILDW